MKRIFLTCAALLFSSQALADECASASTQLEMNRCAAAQYQAADKKLNETYQSAIKRAQPPQRELLQKSAGGMDCTAGRRLRSDSLRYGGRQRATHDRQPVPDR
ncbi:putative secreted protein [Salmonella enterica subsp. enterica]|nr:putative secreted protein [Salmonella enterica subsp. enterica]